MPDDSDYPCLAARDKLYAETAVRIWNNDLLWTDAVGTGHVRLRDVLDLERVREGMAFVKSGVTANQLWLNCANYGRH